VLHPGLLHARAVHKCMLCSKHCPPDVATPNGWGVYAHAECIHARCVRLWSARARIGGVANVGWVRSCIPYCISTVHPRTLTLLVWESADHWALQPVQTLQGFVARYGDKLAQRAACFKRAHAREVRQARREKAREWLRWCTEFAAAYGATYAAARRSLRSAEAFREELGYMTNADDEEYTGAQAAAFARDAVAWVSAFERLLGAPMSTLPLSLQEDMVWGTRTGPQQESPEVAVAYARMWLRCNEGHLPHLHLNELAACSVQCRDALVANPALLRGGKRRRGENELWMRGALLRPTLRASALLCASPVGWKGGKLLMRVLHSCLQRDKPLSVAHDALLRRLERAMEQGDEGAAARVVLQQHVNPRRHNRYMLLPRRGCIAQLCDNEPAAACVLQACKAHCSSPDCLRHRRALAVLQFEN
jgi:hypothetical protein